MEIRVKGEMTIAEIRQALFEKLHEAEAEYGVRYSRGAALYLNPTNGFGDDVCPLRKIVRQVREEHLAFEQQYQSEANDGNEYQYG
ncbi:MAG: hypothetical protein ACK2T3_17960 [Candidatus Promineifilaceae bacterium]